MSKLTFVTARTAVRLVRRDNPSVDESNNSKAAPQRLDCTLSVSNPIPSASSRDTKSSSLLSSGEIPSKGHGTGVMSVRMAGEDGTGYGESTTRDVYVKWASDPKRMSLLAHEVGLYLNELKPLQGSVVPKFLGYFTDSVKNPKFGLMVLEFCEGEPPACTDELNRVVMVMSCKLHAAGVEHNQLFRPRHFVPHNGSLKIVDFTHAKRHQCTNAHPDVRFGSRRDNFSECQELVALENAYGKFRLRRLQHW